MSSAVPTHRSTFAAWLVIGACFILGCAISVRLLLKSNEELPAMHDVVTGLLYFMEDNGARMPASEAEFLQSSFVQRDPGGIRIMPKPGSRFRKAGGVLVPSLEPYRIAWGANLGEVSVSEYGRAMDAQGAKLELVSWAASPPSGKDYTLLLLRARAELLSTSQPAPPSP